MAWSVRSPSSPDREAASWENSRVRERVSPRVYVTVLPSLDSVPPLSRLAESRVVPAGAPPTYTICRRMSSGL